MCILFYDFYAYILVLRPEMVPFVDLISIVFFSTGNKPYLLC
jgi:hypothetical protein